MPVDDRKIEAKVKELNDKAPEGQKNWVMVNGFNLMPEAKVEPNSITVVIQSGLVMKTFVNNSTGEIKLFPLLLFKKDDE